MAELNFSDLDASEAWFGTQIAAVRSIMTSRAALRVAANLGQYNGGWAERLALTALRCTLTSAVRGLGRTADVEWLTDAALSARSAAVSAAVSAGSETDPADSNYSVARFALSAARSAADSADSAYSAARSVALSADTAALSAALSADYATRSADSVAGSNDYAALSAALSALSAYSAARSADSAYSAALSATAWDSARLDLGLNTQALWAGAEIPAAIQDAHDAFLTKMRANPDWDFFRTWYEQMWEGTFTDWDLATEVAKIGDDVWDAGLGAVAEAIRGIEARLLVERLPQVEEVFETDDGLYDVRGTISETSRLIDSVANRVQFALNTALQSNVCDLNEMSMAAKVLRHALENCLDDPNALEQYLRQSSALIKSRVESDDYGTDEALDLLTRTLDETALQLRADHPDVAAAADARLQQRLREIDDAKRLRGAELIEDIQEGTTARLNAEMGLAAETLRDGSSVEASAEALKQNANRAGKISLSERAKKAESSGAMAGLKMGLRTHKLVEFVLGLISSGPM